MENYLLLFLYERWNHNGFCYQGRTGSLSICHMMVLLLKAYDQKENAIFNDFLLVCMQKL